MLTAAVEYLGALPDRERGFLTAGSRSSWPAIVRDMQADYADAEARPSPQLSRRQVRLVEQMLTGAKPLADAVPEGHRALVGRVIAMKRWPGPDGFGWDRVWQVMGGRSTGVTSDTLRKRYERAIGKLARRMDVAGWMQAV